MDTNSVTPPVPAPPLSLNPCQPRCNFIPNDLVWEKVLLFCSIWICYHYARGGVVDIRLELKQEILSWWNARCRLFSLTIQCNYLEWQVEINVLQQRQSLCWLHNYVPFYNYLQSTMKNFYRRVAIEESMIFCHCQLYCLRKFVKMYIRGFEEQGIIWTIQFLQSNCCSNCTDYMNEISESISTY